MNLLSDAKVRRFLPQTKKSCKFFIDLLRRSGGYATESSHKTFSCRKMQSNLEKLR